MTPIGSHGDASEPPTEGRPRVCMHVWNEVRTDERVLRSATALVAAGFDVSILGIERGRPSANGETIRGIHVQHLRVPGWLDAVPLNVGFLVRALWIVVAGTIQLLRTRADVYHAHDSEALPACFIAARLRRGRLVFDAHELPTPLARR